MPDLTDPRPDIVILIDDYLQTEENARRAELASLAGVTESEIDSWRAGTSRPDGVALRYLTGVLRARRCQKTQE